MGSILSKNEDIESLPFYNDLKYDSIDLQVIKTINPTKFIGIIKQDYKNKKLLCKLYGCKSEENADFNILFAIFNCCINEGSGNFDAKIHGIDSNGHVLVTLNYYNRKSSVNYQMLLSEGIIPENHIYYEDYLDLKI